jgi:outer membrane lipoprotein SlyB
VGNKIAVPAEAIVEGRIVDARSSGHFYGDSALAIKITRVAYNGKTFELRSSPYLKQGGSQTRRVAITLSTGAGLGAIIGAIVGGGKGAALGAAIGAGAGSGIQAMSKAAQVQLPAKSMLRFRLETPLTVIPS